MSDGWPAPAQAPPGMPPGWYPDPWYPASMRYWDGRQWTLHAQAAMATSNPLDIVGGRKAADRAGTAFAVQGACAAAIAFVYPLTFASFFHAIQRSADTDRPVSGFPGGSSFALGSGAAQLAGLASLVCTVVIVIWASKATTNARALGRATTHSPGWAIAGWFVPIINFWYPYQVVRDLLPEGHPARPLVARWWALYLAGTFLIFLPIGVGIGLGSGAGALAAILPAAAALTAGLTARRVVAAVADVQDADAAALGVVSRG